MPPVKHLLSDTLAVIAAGSSLAAWQEQLDFWLRILASLVAIVAGGFAIYRYLKPEKK